jgi:hypothetical protein
MSDESTIDALKARIEQLEEEQDRLRQDLSRAQLDEWQGRLDDVGLQMHLATMDLRDRLEPIVQRAQNEIAEARSRIDQGTSTASDAAAAIRSGFEDAWNDLRAAFDDVKASLDR